MSHFEADAESPEQLLAKIKTGALLGAQAPMPTTAYAIVPFSALLVRLGRNTDATARRVQRLDHRRMFGENRPYLLGYFLVDLKRGLTKISSGHLLFAVTDAIAERTPNLRAS